MLTQRLCGLRPRDTMSCEKDVSLEKLFSTRGRVTKVPAPRRRATSPSPTSPSIALRTVIRDTSNRSEEHTSELQSLMRISYAVFCLKTKKKQTDVAYQQTNT